MVQLSSCLKNGGVFVCRRVEVTTLRSLATGTPTEKSFPSGLLWHAKSTLYMKQPLPRPFFATRSAFADARGRVVSSTPEARSGRVPCAICVLLSDRTTSTLQYYKLPKIVEAVKGDTRP